MWMTSRWFCFWCGKVVVLGRPGGTVGGGREKLYRCGPSGGGRADLDYSQQLWKGMGVCQQPGSKTLLRGQKKKKKVLWKWGQEVHHNSWGCSQEIWAQQRDSAKICCGDGEILQFQMGQGGHWEFFCPFKIRVESILHKEIAVHLISLSSLQMPFFKVLSLKWHSLWFLRLQSESWRLSEFQSRTSELQSLGGVKGDPFDVGDLVSRGN